MINSNLYFDYINTVREKAETIHAEVNQHYDDKPYVVHLQSVCIHAMKYLPEDMPENIVKAVIFGSYFHDTIEDARLTYNDVLRCAHRYISDNDSAVMATEIVYALTNEKGRNRAERANDKYYEGIRSTPYASLVKLADRMANFSHAIKTQSRMADCYKKEMPHFIEKVVDIDHCEDCVKTMAQDLQKMADDM